MTSPQDIFQPNGLQRTVSYSLSVSTSPTATFHSPPGGFGAHARGAAPKNLKPFNTKDIKILLLENVNQSGKELLQQQGYQVEALKTSLPEDQLIEKIRYAWLSTHDPGSVCSGGVCSASLRVLAGH